MPAESLAVTAGTCNASRRLPATLVYRNGAVLTADPARPVVDAVAVTRQRLDGTQATGWLPEEQLPVRQAVGAYTAGTAFQAFEDGERGALQVVAVGDLCLLSADITAMSGREIADVEIEGTWVAGRGIHRA
jgi:predicted amidohydrolase YtcJ